MTLGEYIRSYRDQNGLSQRKFADRCGDALTHGYVAMLEKGINPKTGKKLTPSIEVYKAIADVTGVTLDELILLLDSSEPVVLNEKERMTEAQKKELNYIADQLTPENFQLLADFAAMLWHKQ